MYNAPSQEFKFCSGAIYDKGKNGEGKEKGKEHLCVVTKCPPFHLLLRQTWTEYLPRVRF